MGRRRRRMMMIRRRWRERGGMRRKYSAAWWWSNSPWSLFPLVSYPYSSCSKVFFTNKKLNNHIVVIHKKPNRCTRSPGTPVCQSSATTVIRTYQESPACLNTCWWSMVVCLQGCGNKFSPNNSINRHKKLLCGKPHHRKSFSCFSMWGNYHH